MRRRGRFVIEAALLVPGICLLLVYAVFFTLYVHDYAVCAHAMMESGVKGIYRNGTGDRNIEENIRTDLERKLPSRILWMNDVNIEVQANPLRVKIHISGSGYFFPEEDIVVERTIYRIAPCETIRRSRWLRE